LSVIEHYLRSHLFEEGAERREAVKETIKMTQIFLR
jgi:hypothetical protein